MSYNTYMMMNTGGPEHECVREIGNMTSNVAGMWTKALGFRLAEMQGWTGKECSRHLHRALEHMDNPNNSADYEKMTPSNGWGSFGSARSYISDILAACDAHPLATLDISH